MSKIAVVLLMILTIGLVMAGCSDDRPSQEGPAVGRIIGLPTDSGQSPQVGKPAPDFQFQTPDGQDASLSSLQGVPVLINFWRTDCPSCIYEMPFIQQVHDEWTDKGLVTLAINMGESSSKVKGFLQSYNISFPVLLDTNQEVSLGYNVQYIPTTLLIDKDGIIQGLKIGPFLSTEEIEVGIRKVIS